MNKIDLMEEGKEDKNPRINHVHIFPPNLQ